MRRTHLIPGTYETGSPERSVQRVSTGGVPVPRQSSRAPELLVKRTMLGGSETKRGPWYTNPAGMTGDTPSYYHCIASESQHHSVRPQLVLYVAPAGRQLSAHRAGAATRSTQQHQMTAVKTTSGEMSTVGATELLHTNGGDTSCPEPDGTRPASPTTS